MFLSFFHPLFCVAFVDVFVCLFLTTSQSSKKELWETVSANSLHSNFYLISFNLDDLMSKVSPMLEMAISPTLSSGETRIHIVSWIILVHHINVVNSL